MADEDKIANGAVEALIKPVADLIEKIAGPAAEEFGLALRDRVRIFRIKRQVRLWKSVEAMLGEAGFEPKRVPLKLIEPIIAAASVEENDELQDKWAALLANAAIDNGKVHPSFVEVLKQLTSTEVLFLDTLGDLMGRIGRGCKEFEILKNMIERRCPENLFPDELQVELLDLKQAMQDRGYNANLVRLGLIQIEREEGEDYGWYRWTTFGWQFTLVCRPPDKKDHKEAISSKK